MQRGIVAEMILGKVLTCANKITLINQGHQLVTNFDVKKNIKTNGTSMGNIIVLE